MKKTMQGLLGRTLTHSFSVLIHKELGNQQYRLFEVEPEQLDSFFQDSEGLALNVTIPYKQRVIPYCTHLSPEARAIGSVNTILQTPRGLFGHNTDAVGFSYLLKSAGITCADRKVLIFGSGGTALTARYVAEQQNARSIIMVSRSFENACARPDAPVATRAPDNAALSGAISSIMTTHTSRSVSPISNTPEPDSPASSSTKACSCSGDSQVADPSTLSSDVSISPLKISSPLPSLQATTPETIERITYEALDKHRDAEILINTTPVGMYPEHIGRSIADLVSFPCLQGVVDVVYNPLRTALLLQAEALGLPHEGGLGMLVAQAHAAEELFMGHPLASGEIERILGILRTKKENIVLIGMPGSGKSTIGQILGQLSKRPVVCLDEAVEKAAGMTIPEVFEQFGEERFREIESETALRLGAQTGVILVTGGGIVTREQNYAALRQNGRIYHLARDVSLLEREGRPLSLGTDLAEMQERRLPLYTRFRDVVIENMSTPKVAAVRIWREFCENTCS